MYVQIYSQETSHQTYTHVFSLEFKTVSLYYVVFSALAKVQLLDEAWRSDYQRLFDMNKETCLDSGMTLLQVDRPHLDLIIPQVGQDANITLYFNQTVDCEQRKV